MLRLLEVEKGQRVLDVGSGSGWSTALLAHLTGPSGEVLGVEIEADLVAFGRDNLAATGQPWATISRRNRASWACPTRHRSTGSWCPPSPARCPTSSCTSSPTAAGW